MFNKQSYAKNEYMLNGSFLRKGYDWWWHSFTAIDEKTLEEKPFFIEFFIINPALSKDKVVLGQASKENKPSYLMIKAGTWGKNPCQLHRFFPINEVKIQKRPIKIEAGDCYLDETTLKGIVDVKENVIGDMSDLGCIKFDLKIDKKIAFNVGYGTSAIFRFLKAFEMYWHAQGMKSLFEGTIEYNGHKYIVNKESSYGYQDKNWGSNFTSPWVWLSSNNLYSNIKKCKLENSVFDIGGGKPKVFHIALPRKLLGAVYYEGKCYEYNFSKFWRKFKTTFDFKIDDEKVYWYVEQINNNSKIIVNIECLKSDMIFINYEDPNGQKKFKHLYNGGNGVGNIKLYKRNRKEYVLIDDISVKNTGCEYGEFEE